MTALKKVCFLLSFVFIPMVLIAQDIGPNFRRAEIKFNTGDYDGAVEYYTKELGEKPENLNAYYRRGFTYAVMGNHKAAIRDYSIIIRKDPEYVWAYISRGSSKNKLKLYDEALMDFDKAVELDPKNQEAYNNRGWAKYGMGDNKGACKDWKFSKKLGIRI